MEMVTDKMTSKHAWRALAYAGAGSDTALVHASASDASARSSSWAGSADISEWRSSIRVSMASAGKRGPAELLATTGNCWDSDRVLMYLGSQRPSSLSDPALRISESPH